MGGRGGAPRTNLATAIAEAKARAGADPVLEMVKDVFRTSSREGVRDVHIASLHEIRQGLAERGLTDRAVQDRELIRLNREQEIILFPLANQKILRGFERDHIVLGGEKKNGVMMNRKPPK